MMNNTNFKPTVFWAWNGDMSDEDIRREIGEFARSGIGGLHLHARAGLSVEYLGKEWIRAFETSVAECKKYGLDVWIYDEQGWPSGFAGGKVCALGEDYLQKFLCKTLPGEEDGMCVLAAYRKENGAYKRCEKEGAEFVVCYRADEHYVDLLNPRVTDAFIECTHEVYKKEFSSEFGKTIKGIFTDEPQIHVSSLVWSNEIPEAYRKKYGSDVLDGLYLLFEENGEAYREYRYRYYSVVRDLFVHNYTERISRWCEANGLIFTGHFAGEEGLCVQAASNTGVMPHYEYMRQLGVDYLGRRKNPLLLFKQASSVANQFERPRILSEVFACTGNGVSFRELAAIWNYHAVFGVNMSCMSISMHRLGGVRKRDYPVFLSSQQPWWKYFSCLNEYIANVSEFVAGGEASADVLLISAINGALEEPIFSLKQRSASARYRRLAEDLVALQIPYDIGDETIMERHGKAEGGILSIGAGRYSLVVLPELDNISSSTVALLKEFAAGGGRVVCMTKLPERVDGKLVAEPEKVFGALSATLIQQRRGILGSYFVSIGLVRDVCVRDYENRLVEDVILGVRNEGGDRRIEVFNPSSHGDLKTTVCVRGSGKFYLFDPFTGKESPLSSFGDGNETFCCCELSALQARYIRFVRAVGASENADDRKCEIRSRRELPFFLTETEDNLLTLDYARYSVGGAPYSEPLPTVKIHDEVYREAEKHDGAKVRVKYAFDCECAGNRLFLVGETKNAKKILVNGVSLNVATEEYYRDRDFKKYEITDLVQTGENIAEIEYEIPALHLGYELGEVHDAVRNKFSYPVEIESVYILGDFDSEPLGRTSQKINCVTAEGNFRLVPVRENRSPGDLTSRGKWFYAGNAKYETTLEKEDGRSFISAEGYGACCGVSVNGRFAGTVFLQGEPLEITEYLSEGTNLVALELAGTLRNMLGPHHHFKGEVEYTGVHTFTGEYGNGAIEDLSSAEAPDAVWTDRYGFVRFGLEKVIYINKK